MSIQATIPTVAKVQIPCLKGGDRVTLEGVSYATSITITIGNVSALVGTKQLIYALQAIQPETLTPRIRIK